MLAAASSRASDSLIETDAGQYLARTALDCGTSEARRAARTTSTVAIAEETRLGRVARCSSRGSLSSSAAPSFRPKIQVQELARVRHQLSSRRCSARAALIDIECGRISGGTPTAARSIRAAMS